MQVTGPAQSALEVAESNPLTTADTSSTTAFSGAAAQEVAASIPASNLPAWQPAGPATQTRNADAPLTYDDLALPIDPPPPIAQRFNATIPIREQQLEQERTAALVMPAIEQLAVTQQIELQRVAESVRELVDQQTQSNSAGRLASIRDESIEQPSVTTEERQRHWIRQPD